MAGSELHIEQVPAPGGGNRRIRVDEIHEPGAYVLVETGDLIRVTPDGTTGDDPSNWPLGGDHPAYVVQISRNPYLAISQARLAAANLDIEINF